MNADPISRFGCFELNARTCELYENGKRVALAPQPARVLALLVSRAGDLVTRDEIFRQIWGRETFVDFELGLNLCVNRIRSALGDNARAPVFVETLQRRGYRFIARVVKEPAPSVVTLAILPFDNLNRDQEYDYFADGVTDALITELGQISSLRVISRQSVLHLKGCDRHLKDIARELNVDAFVEGATLRERDRIRISSQLIRAEPEEHLWAHSYECDITDLLAVQGKLVRAIASAVQAAVTPAEFSRLERKRIARPDAHEAYLKARFHWSKWSEEGFRKGLEYFQAAIDRDPSYAPPFAGMANCIALLGFWGHLPIRQAYPKARMAALRAVELDDNLSEAHAALSWIQWLHDWDLPGAEKEAKRAVELNPSDETACFTYAVFLATIRMDHEQAISYGRRALRIDPLSLYSSTCMAWILLFAGEYDRAIEQSRATLDLYRDSIQALYVLGLGQAANENYEDAIDALQKAVDLSRDAIGIGYLGHACALAGRVDQARALLGELLEKTKYDYVPPKSLVSLYTGLGEYDRAFECLERAYQDQDSFLYWLRVVPVFRPLRADPRFDELSARIGLGGHSRP